MIGQTGAGSPEVGTVRLAFFPVFMFTPCGPGQTETRGGLECVPVLASLGASSPEDLYFFTVIDLMF